MFCRDATASGHLWLNFYKFRYVFSVLNNDNDKYNFLIILSLALFNILTCNYENSNKLLQTHSRNTRQNCFSLFMQLDFDFITY
jgi:hypothetical protein